MEWVSGRLNISFSGSKDIGNLEAERKRPEEGVKAGNAQPTGLHSSSRLRELFDNTKPQTNGEKALVAGYWIQVVQGVEELTAHAINSELKHLGHGVSKYYDSP